MIPTTKVLETLAMTRIRLTFHLSMPKIFFELTARHSFNVFSRLERSVRREAVGS